MSFIGIFTDSKNYAILKSEILEHINEKSVNIMKINKNNLDSIKNIKFDVIIIDNYTNGIEEKMQSFEKMLNNVQYLVINSDIDFKYNILIKEKINIITYGLNHKATVTVSSVEENDILIALQRDIKDIYGNINEIKEEVIEFDRNNRLKLGNQMIIYIILLIFKQK